MRNWFKIKYISVSPIIEFVPMAGFVDEEELAGGGVAHGLGQPVGELAPPAAELHVGVPVLQQARLVQLAQQAGVLD